MLVLTRKATERIKIGEDITITIQRIAGKHVVVGIKAPREVSVVRDDAKHTEAKA